MLTACSPNTSASKRSNIPDGGASCDPQTVSLSAGLQDEIVRTGAWPAKLQQFPHTGRIRFIELASANGLLPGATDPSIETAHKVVDVFENTYDSTGALVLIMPQNPLVHEGEFLLTEFDQNCPKPNIATSSQADQTT